MQNKFHNATLTYIAGFLQNREDEQELKAIFEAIDLNGDGRLSRTEVLNAYEILLGLGLCDVETIFDSCDLDNSGYVDYTEFIVATTN